MPAGLLDEVKQSGADYQTELFSLNVKALTINSSVCNMDDVIGSIQASTRVQEQKLEAHPYLRPDCDKSWLEWAGDKLDAAWEYCKENWKAVVLIAGMIVCTVACAVVTLVCPAAGAIIVAISKAFLFGQLIGGGLAAGITVLQGGSFRQIAESYFDGAFLGGFGALTACAMMTPLVSLTFGGAVSIGGVSVALPQTLSYYGDRFFKGEEISDKEIIIGSVLAALHGAIFAAIFYIMSNGINFKGKGRDTAKGHEDVLDDSLKDETGSVDDGLKGGSETKLITHL